MNPERRSERIKTLEEVLELIGSLFEKDNRSGGEVYYDDALSDLRQNVEWMLSRAKNDDEPEDER